jgi:hypothetical protein
MVKIINLILFCLILSVSREVTFWRALVVIKPYLALCDRGFKHGDPMSQYMIEIRPSREGWSTTDEEKPQLSSRSPSPDYTVGTRGRSTRRSKPSVARPLLGSPHSKSHPIIISREFVYVCRKTGHIMLLRCPSGVIYSFLPSLQL